MSLAEKINKRLIQFEPQFLAMVDTEVSYIQIRKLLNAFLKPFNGHALLVPSGSGPKTFIQLTGEYNPDWPKGRWIKIYIHCRTGSRSLKLTRKFVDHFRHSIAMIVTHELIHNEQYKQRLKKGVNPERLFLAPFSTRKRVTPVRHSMIKYLRDSDEIDAYAFELAYEIKRYYPKVPARDVLATVSRRAKLSTFRFYRNGFEGFNWTAVRQRLLRRTYKWLPQIIVVPPLTME